MKLSLEVPEIKTRLNFHRYMCWGYYVCLMSPYIFSHFPVVFSCRISEAGDCGRMEISLRDQRYVA